MSRIGICHACEVGDHKHHHRVVQAVPEGMMGGVICDCKGECKEEAPGRMRRMLEAAGLLRAVPEREEPKP